MSGNERPVLECSNQDKEIHRHGSLCKHVVHGLCIQVVIGRGKTKTGRQVLLSLAVDRSHQINTPYSHVHDPEPECIISYQDRAKALPKLPTPLLCPPKTEQTRITRAASVVSIITSPFNSRIPFRSHISISQAVDPAPRCASLLA